MPDIIIVIILVIVVAVGIRETVKHFKGQGSCCGGSTVKPQKKRLKNKVVRTYTFHINGMHCQNCANEVTRAINDIDGASATVSLRSKTAKVKCDREIDEQIIKDAISKKGFYFSDYRA